MLSVPDNFTVKLKLNEHRALSNESVTVWKQGCVFGVLIRQTTSISSTKNTNVYYSSDSSVHFDDLTAALLG